MDHRKASKMHAHMMRLPDLKKRVRELENELKKIREGMQ
jgi:polyhydroxyalkanoate synthesis regulator phasin